MRRILLIISLISACMCAYAAAPESLAQIAESYNKGCPKTAGEGLTLNKVEPTDSAFTFVYVVDGAMYDRISKLGAILHDSTLAEMQSSPREITQQLLDICRKDKINIVVRFANGDGKSFELVMLPSEL